MGRGSKTLHERREIAIRKKRKVCEFETIRVGKGAPGKNQRKNTNSEKERKGAEEELGRSFKC